MKKILIIEDNIDNLELCALILEGKYQVITSYNGTDGLKKIYDEKPDLILLDLSLPDIDGIHIAYEIKSKEEYRHIPVIALTAHSLDDDRIKAMQAGCDEYIVKPFEVKHLLRVINKFLGE